MCAYQFLTGRLPHEYTSLTELALKQQQDPVTPITELRPEVPPELDEAVRLCLEREAERALRIALQFAQAIEAGLLRRGHRRAPGASRSRTPTPRAGAAIDTAATRALPRPTRADAHARAAAHARSVARPAARCATSAPTRSAGAAAAQLGHLPRAAGGHRGDRRRLALVLLSSSRQEQVQPVDEHDVQQQIDGLRDFISEHSR